MFGMGTGVTLSTKSPENFKELFSVLLVFVSTSDFDSICERGAKTELQ